MPKSIPIELLAPARDLQVGVAAINAGADAVYIGAPKFSARQAAGCSMQDIAALVRYAHLFQVKVLVALNTLLTDDELPIAVRMIHDLHAIAVDAIIIQDLRLLQYPLPPIRLHASTQCDNQTADHILRLQSLGLKRAVLARELSLAEIEHIHQSISNSNQPIELEAFIHGALCVSYSGRCYMSEYLCNRSANRGNCAQLCRQPYDMLDSQGRIVRPHCYPLSLHDMDRSAHIHELLRAGVTTLKIEGRLKDANYVRNITAYYRRLLDALFAQADSPYCRASLGDTDIDFQPDPAKTFHRGQTDYFMHGRTKDMANWLSPKSTGEPIGSITSIAQGRNTTTITLRTEAELHNGDGLCFADKGFFVNSVTQTAAKTDANKHKAVRITTSKPIQAPIGTLIYRNFDKTFTDTLSASKAQRRLGVKVILEENAEGFTLTYSTPTLNISQTFKTEKIIAQNPDKAYQTTKQQLIKLGGTPFVATEVLIRWSQPYFLPSSVLNEWRRTTLAAYRTEQILSTDHEPQMVEYPTDITYQKTNNSNLPPAPQLTSTTPLMTCRYCILHEMGNCRKINPLPPDKELRLIRTIPANTTTSEARATTFRLHFDCAKCQMLIMRDL